MTPTDSPARGAHVYAVEIDGEAVLLDESDNRLHRLNATAALLWACFDGTTTVRQIATEVSEEFGLPYDTVLADVLAVADDLREQGLLREPA